MDEIRKEIMYKILEEGKITERCDVMRINGHTAVRGYKVEYEGKVYAVIAVNGDWAYYMEV